MGPTLASTIPIVTLAHKSWESLHTSFANKSHTRIICLQDQLARITKDSSLIVHSIVNELAIGGAQINDVQLTLRILQGLGPNYDIIFAAIRSHETLIT